MHFFHIILSVGWERRFEIIPVIAERIIALQSIFDILLFPELSMIMHESWNCNFSLLRMKGGVAVYNKLLHLGDDSDGYLFEVLSEISASMSKMDLVEVMRNELDFPQIINLLHHPNSAIVSQCLIICQNFMCYGDEYVNYRVPFIYE